MIMCYLRPIGCRYWKLRFGNHSEYATRNMANMTIIRTRKEVAMEERYYHKRDLNNKPRLTGCLLIEDGHIARGLSLCSMKDNPCKKRGRKIALDRAIWAMENKRSSLAISRWEATEILLLTKSSFTSYSHKAVYNPVLTDFELGLVR